MNGDCINIDLSKVQDVAGLRALVRDAVDAYPDSVVLMSDSARLDDSTCIRHDGVAVDVVVVCERTLHMMRMELQSYKNLERKLRNQIVHPDFALLRLASQIKDKLQDITDDRYHRVRRQPSRAYRMSCERRIRAYTAALPKYERELNDDVLPMICSLQTEIAETMKLQVKDLRDDFYDHYSDFYDFYDLYDYYYFFYDDYSWDSDDVTFFDDGVSSSEMDRKARVCARRMTAVLRKLRNTRRLGVADRMESTSRTGNLSVKPRGGRMKKTKPRVGRFKPGNQALFGLDKCFA